MTESGFCSHARGRTTTSARSCAARPVAGSRPSRNPASPRRIRTAYISNIRRKLPSPIAPARAKNWRMAAKGAAPSRACLRSDVQVSQRAARLITIVQRQAPGQPSHSPRSAPSPARQRHCDLEHIGQQLAIDTLPLPNNYVIRLSTRASVKATATLARPPGPSAPEAGAAVQPGRVFGSPSRRKIPTVSCGRVETAPRPRGNAPKSAISRDQETA